MTLVTPDLLPAAIELPVDEDCIRRGMPKTPGYCPVALAIRKLYPSAAGISVGVGTVSISLASGGYALYDLGAPGRSFIRDFDGRRQRGPVRLYLTRTYNWRED